MRSHREVASGRLPLTERDLNLPLGWTYTEQPDGTLLIRRLNPSRHREIETFGSFGAAILIFFVLVGLALLQFRDEDGNAIDVYRGGVLWAGFLLVFAFNSYKFVVHILNIAYGRDEWIAGPNLLIHQLRLGRRMRSYTYQDAVLHVKRETPDSETPGDPYYEVSFKPIATGSRYSIASTQFNPEVTRDQIQNLGILLAEITGWELFSPYHRL